MASVQVTYNTTKCPSCGGLMGIGRNTLCKECRKVECQKCKRKFSPMVKNANLKLCCNCRSKAKKEDVAW